jgi:hypothetical protein
MFYFRIFLDYPFYFLIKRTGQKIKKTLHNVPRVWRSVGKVCSINDLFCSHVLSHRTDGNIYVLNIPCLYNTKFLQCPVNSLR